MVQTVDQQLGDSFIDNVWPYATVLSGLTFFKRIIGQLQCLLLQAKISELSELGPEYHTHSQYGDLWLIMGPMIVLVVMIITAVTH